MHASAIYYLKANVFLTVNNMSEIYPVHIDLKKRRAGRNGRPIYNGQETDFNECVKITTDI